MTSTSDLHAHPEWQETILDALPAHIALLDEDGVILAVNASWRKVAEANSLSSGNYGVGTNYLEVCKNSYGSDLKESDAAERGIRQVLEGKLDRFAMEYPCHTPTEEQWFQLLVTPLPDNTRGGAVVAHVNVTARKLTEAKLRTSEERFRATFEQSAVGIAHVGQDGRFLRVNDKLCDITGYPRPELMELTFMDLTLPEELAMSVEARKSMLSGSQRTFSTEKRYRKKDGEIVWINLMTTLAVGIKADETYFISVFADITKRKQAELRLQRMNRLYAVLSKTAEVIARGRDVQGLYDEVCRILVEEGLLTMALVMVAEEDGGLRKVAEHYGDFYAYNTPEAQAPLHLTSLDIPEGQGTIGTAVRTGMHDVCNDFCADPRMAPWHESAQNCGFNATASFPLKWDGRTTGALVVAAREAGYFKEDEIRLLVTVANDLSFAIETLRLEEQRVRAENALRMSEANLALAQKIGHFGSWELELANMDDVDANELRWSDEMFRIAGYEPGSVEVNNELFFKLTHPDDHELIRQTMAAAVRERQPYSVVHRLIRPDGEERIVHETAQLFMNDETGHPMRMLGTAHDITENQRMEQARRESEDKFRQLVDNMTDVFWIMSPDMKKMQYVSAAYEPMWGRKIQSLYDDTDEWADAIVEEDRLKANEQFLSLGKDMPKVSMEYRILRADGKVRWIFDRGFQIRDEQGRLVRVAGIATDVTERKLLEQQFLRTQRMESIGTLAGGIAHDLNNVLTPVMMSIELLKLNETDPKRLRVLATIESSTRRGAAMVQQVLSFARGIEGDRLEVAISPLLKEVEKITNETFLKNILVNSSAPDDLWTVKGDPTQLHQVLINLCVNARDAMPEGGTLMMMAANVHLDEAYATLNLDAKVGPYVVIQVEDTGTGMSAEVVERIFEPFYTTKEMGKGTGLGLSTMMAIVKSHGGFVRVYSELGMGTRFHVYLPAYTEGREKLPVVETLSLPHGNGELLLVVDDEEPVRQITQQTLQAFGYRVLVAVDGVEATAIFAQRRDEIALVLTDMMMPNMDGPTLIPVLMRINPKVKIIAASGLNANGMVAKATSAGVKHFIPKPYTAEGLLMTLQDVLKGGQMPCIETPPRKKE